MIRLAATIPLEVAHLGTDGVMHGHSLSAEVWTSRPVDLDAWRAELVAATAHIGFRPLHDSIGGRTFEDVGHAILAAVDGADRVVIRLPTLGHVIEVSR